MMMIDEEEASGGSEVSSGNSIGCSLSSVVLSDKTNPGVCRFPHQIPHQIPERVCVCVCLCVESLDEGRRRRG